MISQKSPVWRNDDLEGAVIGAFFLRGVDPEVMDILATLPADVFFVRQYRDIYAGICRQARVSGVIDPVLLCNEMPELAPVITDTGRKTWVKSSLEHYVAALRRNAALRDAEKTLTEAHSAPQAKTGLFCSITYCIHSSILQLEKSKSTPNFSQSASHTYMTGMV